MPKATSSTIHESQLLQHIFARSKNISRDFPHVVAGPGHDCAVVKCGKETLLLKVDQIISGLHFLEYPKTPLKLIARKALARALSDIAAAGGTPVCALAAAAIPAGFSQADELFDWVHRAGATFKCPVVGGDICKTRGPLALSISVVGRPHTRRGPVLRSGAKPGDLVYVTGRLGNSFDRKTGRGKHLTFTPRVSEAKVLCDRLGNKLHAMMDISDGLGKDAGRLAEMSGVSIALEAETIPRDHCVCYWQQALGDGEDYELFFAVAAGAKVPRSIGGTRVTRVGRVVRREKMAVWIEEDGKRIAVDELGWEH